MTSALLGILALHSGGALLVFGRGPFALRPTGRPGRHSS